MEELDAGSPIDVKQFFSECKSCLSEYDCCLTDDYTPDTCFEFPGTFEASRFDPRDLLPEGGRSKEFLEKIEDTKGFKVLENKKSEMERKTVFKDNKNKERAYKHMSDSPWVHKLLRGIEPNPSEEDRVKLPDVLIKIHFFKAVKDKKMRHTRSREFDVLGQMSLFSLKEKFYCPSDFICPRNYAKNPDAPLRKLSKDVYKSSFFFIEGTFYNDVNDANCIDLSQIIREWAKERKEHVGPFHNSSMSGVKFVDLTFKLGQPYLYMHQGECEHLIVFSDVRMVTEADCHQLSKYPLETFRSKNRRISCKACGHTVKWIVFNSSFSPDNPDFFCDLCLKMLHYDEQGNLLDQNIQVYCHPVWASRPLRYDEIEEYGGDTSDRSKAEPVYFV